MTEALEIRTPHTDVSDIVRELAPSVDDLSIRLPCERPIPDGEWVRFVVQLVDGTTVFEGIGRSQGTRPEGPRYRVHLSLLQFDERNEVMYERMLLARDAEAERTGQFDLGEIGAELIRGASRSAPAPGKSAPPAPPKSKMPIAPPRGSALPPRPSAPPPPAKGAAVRRASEAPGKRAATPPPKPARPTSTPKTAAKPAAPPRPSESARSKPPAPKIPTSPPVPARSAPPPSPPAAKSGAASRDPIAPPKPSPSSPRSDARPPAAKASTPPPLHAAASKTDAPPPAAGAADEDVITSQRSGPPPSARSSELPPRRRRRQRVPVDDPELATMDTVISRPDLRVGVSLQVPPRLVERARALAPTLPDELTQRRDATPEEAVLHAALRLGLASLAAIADDDES